MPNLSVDVLVFGTLGLDCQMDSCALKSFYDFLISLKAKGMGS